MVLILYTNNVNIVALQKSTYSKYCWGDLGTINVLQ